MHVPSTRSVASGAGRTAEGPAGPGERMRSEGGLRLDIQGLRALAVGLVVVYHFWPTRLTGGYVGVDVFFVISGFLITTHLIGRPPTRPGDLAAFWGRRIRRLLPAAFLVLAATLVATRLFAPETTWRTTASQVAAAGFYVQNWALAHEAVDYLAADNAATPVQHYWSLSIEEQFYLIWPVLVLAGWWAARRFGWSSRAVFGGLVGLVVAASLACSIRWSGHDPAAYFLSWTRFWELGIGALAAIAAPALARALGPHRAVRQVMAWLGIAGVLVSAVTFDAGTTFPGVAALLPVVATAVVILADSGPGRLSVSRVAGWRPVHGLGDISYSVYLWHWPVVVLLPMALGHPAGWLAKVLGLAAVLAVATATKRWVEDPLRGRRPLGEPLRRSFVFAVAGMTVVAAGALWLRTDAGVDQQRLPFGAPCFGAAAARDAGCQVHGAKLLTDPVFAQTDKPAVYTDDCMSAGAFERHVTCTYGQRKDPSLRVALIGNSHAGQYLPPLITMAKKRHWRIDTYLAYECHTVDRVVVFPEADRTAGCKTWNDWAIGSVEKGGYDLVVTTNRTQRPIQGLSAQENVPATQEAYSRVLRRWTDAGAKVLVIHDDPRRAADDSTGPDCVAEHQGDLGACDKPLSRSRVWDPQYDAATALRSAGDEAVRTWDPTPFICPGDVCRSVVGGVIVWWDTNHLTTTFARTLTPALRGALAPLVPPA